MDYRSIIFKVENRVATATINRPEAANTINVDAKDELLSIIKEVSRNDDIGVLVLTGAGRIFCAGGDFRPSKVRKGEVSGETAEDMQPAYDEVRKGKILPDVIELSMALQRLEKPTIAMINGPVIGHGFDVALCCDVRTGSPASRFTVGFTNMGLPPVAGGVWLLPRIVGLGRALELILRGGWFSAEEAYRIGLLNHLFPADQLEKETMALAATSNIPGRYSSSGPGSIPSQPAGNSLSRKPLTSFRKASSSAVYRKSIDLPPSRPNYLLEQVNLQVCLTSFVEMPICL